MLFSKEEDLALVKPAKLNVDIEVVLVKGLKAWVKKAREEGVGSLFDDFSTGFAGIMFSAHCAHAEDVQGVLRLELVVGSDDEFEFVDGDVNCTEESLDDEAVVIDAVGDLFKRGLHVVEEGVNVRKSAAVSVKGQEKGSEVQYFDVDTCLEKVGNLGHSNKVSCNNVSVHVARASNGIPQCGAPVGAVPQYNLRSRSSRIFIINSSP
jgi:hypothetical protein